MRLLVKFPRKPDSKPLVDHKIRRILSSHHAILTSFQQGRILQRFEKRGID